MARKKVITKKTIKKRNFIAGFSLVILTLFFVSSSLLSFERKDLVPSQGHVMIRLSDGSGFIDSLINSPLGKLWNSPEMKPFLNNRSLADTLIKSVLENDKEDANKEKIVDTGRQIFSLFKDEFILAFNLKSIGKTPDFLVLAEMKAEDYQKYLELIKAESELYHNKKSTFNYSTFQDIEMVQQINEREKGTPTWHTFCAGTLITAKNREWVEKCIVRLQNESLQQRELQPILEVCLPENFVDYQASGKQELESQLAPGTKTLGLEVPRPDRPSQFEVMGLDDIGKITFQFQMQPSICEANLRIRLKGEASGLLTLLSRDPIPSRHTLAYVPPDVLTYSVIRADIHAIWREIPVMMAILGAEDVTQYQAALNQAAQVLQVDLGRDIIGNLDTLVTIYSRLDGIEEQTLYCWQLRNAAGMEKTLGKLFGEGSWLRMMMKDDFELHELPGHQVYSFKVPRMKPVPADNPNDSKPVPQFVIESFGITVVEGDLVFGPLHMVRTYIEGSRDNKAARAFYQSPFFTRMIRRVPDNATYYSISDITKWLEPGIKLIKALHAVSQTPSSPIQKEIPATPGSNARKKSKPPQKDAITEYLDNLDFTQLPSAEFISSFLGPLGMYMQFDGKEILVKWECHSAPQKSQKKK